MRLKRSSKSILEVGIILGSWRINGFSIPRCLRLQILRTKCSCAGGGAASSTEEEVVATLSAWSKNKLACCVLCAELELLTDAHPGPRQDSWVTFGFCACSNELSEGFLASLYKN